MADPLPRPTFLIIGAQKSGTRWLRLNLGEHPEVYTAPGEIGYFSSAERYADGVAWYEAHFEGWAGERIVGEATPAYMMWRHHPRKVARRVQRYDRDMKLIAVLRNPVDRAYSAFVHHMRKGRLPHDADLLEYISSVRPQDDPLGLVAGGWYYTSLRPFRRRFRDNLLILLHDDVTMDPVGVYRKALRHVGADPTFLPPELDEVRFNNTPPPDSGLRDREGGYRRLKDVQRRQLYGYFRDDLRKLERMIGTDLDAWLPPARPVPVPNAV